MDKKIAIVLIAVTCVWPMAASAQICSTSNDTECPANSVGNHRIYPWAFGELSMTGADRYYIGTLSNGQLGACYYDAGAGVWRGAGIVDENSNSTPYGLAANSHICLGAGGDYVRLQTGSTFTCGTVTMYPFDSNGYTLTVYGNEGDDDLNGSLYDATYMCGGPGSDEMNGPYGSSIHDGYTDADRSFSSLRDADYFEVWGNSGNDVVDATALNGLTGQDIVVDTGSGTNDCIDLAFWDTQSVSCGLDGGHSSVAGTNCTVDISSCSWTANGTASTPVP